MRINYPIDALTEREIFSHTFSNFCKVRFRIVDNTIETKPPFKQQASDMAFILSVTHMKQRRGKHLYSYHTNICIDLPIGYYAEIHALETLLDSGYAFANGTAIVEGSQKNQEIVLHLCKWDDESPCLAYGTEVAKIVVKKWLCPLT
jgi:hypothetical protein